MFCRDAHAFNRYCILKSFSKTLGLFWKSFSLWYVVYITGLCIGKQISHLPEQSITTLMTGTTGGQLKQVSTVILLSILWSRLVLTLMPGHEGHRIEGRSKPAHPRHTPSTRRLVRAYYRPSLPTPSLPVIRDLFSALSSNEEKVYMRQHEEESKKKKRQLGRSNAVLREAMPPLEVDVDDNNRSSNSQDADSAHNDGNDTVTFLRRNLPHSWPVFARSGVCVMLDARNACVLNVKKQQEGGGWNGGGGGGGRGKAGEVRDG